MNHHFITGTSQGIGLALARTLLDRDPDNRVTGLSRSCEVEHPNYQHITIDLSDSAAVSEFRFPELPQATRLVLVNNAGSLGSINHLGRLDSEALARGFALNLAAPAVLVNEFVAAYQVVSAAKLVINLSSGAATKPYDGWGPYCSAKAGLEMLTQVADQEQIISRPNHPIVFKSVSPGPVQTAMQAQIRDTSASAFSQVERFRTLAATNALPSPEAIAIRFAELIENPQSHPGVVHRFA